MSWTLDSIVEHAEGNSNYSRGVTASSTGHMSESATSPSSSFLVNADQTGNSTSSFWGDASFSADSTGNYVQGVYHIISLSHTGQSLDNYDTLTHGHETTRQLENGNHLTVSDVTNPSAAARHSAIATAARAAKEKIELTPILPLRVCHS